MGIDDTIDVSSSSIIVSDACVVCGDKAIGRHYGAIACNGCKGFFRRTVWQNLQYTCRFTNACNIDKDHRNACRSCRFHKCLADGMKPEAIQNERDRIGSTKRNGASRKRTLSTHQSSPATTVNTTYQNHHLSSSDDDGPSPPRIHAATTATASLVDVLIDIESRLKLHHPDGFESTTSRQRVLSLMIGWANMLHPFQELPIVDKVLLLKHSSAAFGLLHIAQRSLSSHAVCLPNDTYLPATPNIHLPDLTNVTNKLVDEIIAPLRRLSIDEAEIASLKAFVLLSPDVVGIASNINDRVRSARDGLLRAMFSYLCEKNMSSPIDASVRLSNLLLIVPALFAVSQTIVDNMQLGALFGLGDYSPVTSVPTTKDMMFGFAPTLIDANFPMIRSTASSLQLPVKVFMA